MGNYLKSLCVHVIFCSRTNYLTKNKVSLAESIGYLLYNTFLKKSNCLWETLLPPEVKILNLWRNAAFSSVATYMRLSDTVTLAIIVAARTYFWKYWPIVRESRTWGVSAKKKLQADYSSGSKVRDQRKLKIFLLVKCYGDLRIWPHRTSSLNMEISVFGTESVKVTSFLL